MPEDLKKTMDTLFPIKDELPFNISIHERTTHYANMEKRAGFHICYEVMEEREARLVEALEFYACSKNYNSTAPYGAGITHPTLIFEDDGYRARKALKEIRKAASEI